MNVKKVRKAITISALTLSLILGGTTMVCIQKNHKVSSPKQVSTIASELNADMTVMTNNKENKVYRLDHNNGEPIYVSIDENFTSSEKNNITWSLDYVFDIVGEIEKFTNGELYSYYMQINFLYALININKDKKEETIGKKLRNILLWSEKLDEDCLPYLLITPKM
jgi:hypothetical protein